jgi:drug/metabolite transporter (DMT)-like permease
MMMVWGLNLSAVKVLTESLDVMLVASIRMVMATAVMTLVGWYLQPSGLEEKSEVRWGYLLVAGFFLVYCQQIAFAEGLKRTSATNAALVMALGPCVSLLMERAAFGRVIRQLQIIGIVAALLGVSVVVLNRPHAEFTGAAWGDVWIFCSVLAFALGGLFVQKMSQTVSPMRVTVGVHLVGTVLLCGHVMLSVSAPAERVLHMGRLQWGMAAFSAVFATGLGALVWSKGIATIGVGRTASYLSWVPIFGVCFGMLFLSEPVTLWLLVGLMGVLLGSLLVVKR